MNLAQGPLAAAGRGTVALLAALWLVSSLSVPAASADHTATVRGPRGLATLFVVRGFSRAATPDHAVMVTDFCGAVLSSRTGIAL